MTSKADIEKRIATMGDPKSDGKWAEHYEKVQRQKRIDNHTMQQWGLNKKPATNSYRDLVKYGVLNSPVSVSKAPQGSMQHKTEVENHINKVVADNEPKIADQKIFENNINGKRFNRKEPVALKFASPKQIGQLAERLEENRQMMGDESTWDGMKRTAKTPQERQEIRDIIKEDYKKHGAKDMDESDLKWIGKAKSQQSIMNFKIDVDGISNSINNYINATRDVPVPPPKKQRDPDLNLGLAAILGETYDG
jgi:hypothetical protein